MQGSGIVPQVVEIKKVNKANATHFALCNGSQLRYLIDLNGGAKRLSKNISTYSKKLQILMQFINVFPLSLLVLLKLGYFAEARLCPEVEKCRERTNKKHWNMIIGTYDEKQKVVIQCFNNDGIADFIKVGNETTEEEMNAEVTFLSSQKKYETFATPELLFATKITESSPFNIQVTKEIRGNKVEPVLTQEIVDIYKELSKDTKDSLAFSHGDFAPWNMKISNGRITLFDWEHCGYRIPGFDLMHYTVIVLIVMQSKNLEESFDEGMKTIQSFFPEYRIDKELFISEFEKLRKQINRRG